MPTELSADTGFFLAIPYPTHSNRAEVLASDLRYHQLSGFSDLRRPFLRALEAYALWEFGEARTAFAHPYVLGHGEIFILPLPLLLNF